MPYTRIQLFHENNNNHIYTFLTKGFLVSQKFDIQKSNISLLKIVVFLLVFLPIR